MKLYPVECNNCGHNFETMCIENPPRVFLCTGCGKTMILESRDPEQMISYYRIYVPRWEAE